MINSSGEIHQTEALGDIVQSLAIYNNKLIVAVNNSQKLLLFDISTNGLSNKTEILTTNSPREIVVIGDYAYFGSWDPDYSIYQTNPGDINVLNLKTSEIEKIIQVDIMPEGLLYYNNYLWVANSGSNTISKIDVISNTLVENIEVGKGPVNLINHNNEIYVSRTYYDTDWNTHHASSRINSDNITLINFEYGSGVACGGSIIKYNNQIYRSYDGGLLPLNQDLSINISGRIGDFNQPENNKFVYHIEIINENLWFSIRDGNNPGEIRIIDESSNEIARYIVGPNPGDFAYWHQAN